MTFGEQLKRLRHDRRWTQNDLARESGLTFSAVSKLEIGDREPTLFSLLALARALGVSLAVFDEVQAK